MVFQFEHITLGWDAELGKWRPKQLDLIALKAVFNRWQQELAGKGWNSLFWNNHDLPRAVSRFGNDGRYRVESAKMLATALHFLQGTPYIYQGEEIGMTNVRFDRLDDYNDIELHNAYREKVVEQGVLTHEQMMDAIYQQARDNARTPMQWDDSTQAGFTTGNPWLAVNPNYQQINVKQSLADEHSIFQHYRQLIALRRNSRWSSLMIEGRYVPLIADHPAVWAYLREGDAGRLLVVCNFYEAEVTVSLDEQAQSVVLSNWPDSCTDLKRLYLRAYEAVVFELRT